MSSEPGGSSDPSATFDRAHFRAVLGHFPTGVTVVTGLAAGRPIGFTVGSFTSISLDPPLVGFFAMNDSDTWLAMANTSGFCVNVLRNTQADLCWRFARSGNENVRFDGIHRAIEQGHLDAIAVTASAYATARSVTFYEARPEQTSWTRVRRIGRATRLNVDHLMASAAVPFASGTPS